MSASEINILRQFRRYHMRASEMLFFNCSRTSPHSRHFTQAMLSLIERKMVIQERHKNAYSLTENGYRASLSA